MNSLVGTKESRTKPSSVEQLGALKAGFSMQALSKHCQDLIALGVSSISDARDSKEANRSLFLVLVFQTHVFTRKMMGDKTYLT